MNFQYPSYIEVWENHIKLSFCKKVPHNQTMGRVAKNMFKVREVIAKANVSLENFVKICNFIKYP